MHVVIVEGLGGELRYAEQFDSQVETIRSAAASVASDGDIRAFRGDEAIRAVILEYFGSLGNEIAAIDQLVVYLVGHGSYDDHEYKFNLPGEDLTGADLAAALDALGNEYQLIVATSSASGALADLLQNDSRMLILATRSGNERHATRFGNYFAAGLADDGADVDKDGRISAREAFDFAARQVEDFYAGDNRLATEHPRAEGERLDRITLARLESPARAVDDARLRELFAERDAASARVDELRLRSDSMPEEEYRQALLQEMLGLALLEEEIERREAELDED
jgi:hypothetical protein